MVPPPRRVAKRARTPNIRYVPPESTTNNTPATEVVRKKRGRSTVTNKAPAAPANVRALIPSRSYSPVSDVDEVPAPIHHRTTGAAHKRAVETSSSLFQLQPSAGVNQIELMKKLHEYDKQNAVLQAKLDFANQSSERLEQIQNNTKALCFEILDKGADLTKKGATVATENNAALSSTISTVVAATRRYGKEESSVCSSASYNHMMHPVLPAPTVVNFSTRCVSAAEESSSSSSLSRFTTSSHQLLTTSQQQHHTEPNPVIVVAPSCNPVHNQNPTTHQQQPAVNQFYPTIQGMHVLFILFKKKRG